LSGRIADSIARSRSFARLASMVAVRFQNHCMHAKFLGRKTFDLSVKMGARFSGDEVHYIFSRGAPPASVPVRVEFVTESIRVFAERLREQGGKNIWLMGGGEIIGSFLDEQAIDEFIITVVPIFIGEGTSLRQLGG
jgi:dihydrofolate reductase